MVLSKAFRAGMRSKADVLIARSRTDPLEGGSDRHIGLSAVIPEVADAVQGRILRGIACRTAMVPGGGAFDRQRHFVVSPVQMTSIGMSQACG